MRPEDRLTLAYVQGHPREAAHRFELIPPHDVAAILAALPPPTIALVLEQCRPPFGAEVVQAFSSDLVAPCLSAMTPSAAVRVLRCCDRHRQQEFLNSLDKRSSVRLQRAMASIGNTAGSLADPRVLTLPPDITVADALDRIAQTPEHAEHYVYVVDQAARLRGVVTMKTLIAADPRHRIESMMSGAVMRLSSDTPLTELRSHEYWKRFPMLPIVDRTGTFFGALHSRVLWTFDERSVTDVSLGTTVSHMFLTLVELYALVGIQLMTSLSSAFSSTGSQPANRKKEYTTEH